MSLFATAPNSWVTCARSTGRANRPSNPKSFAGRQIARKNLIHTISHPTGMRRIGFAGSEGAECRASRTISRTSHEPVYLAKYGRDGVSGACFDCYDHLGMPHRYLLLRRMNPLVVLANTDQALITQSPPPRLLGTWPNAVEYRTLFANRHRQPSGDRRPGATAPASKDRSRQRRLGVVALLFLFMLITLPTRRSSLAGVPIMKELNLTPKSSAGKFHFFFLFSLSAIATGFIVNHIQSRWALLGWP